MSEANQSSFGLGYGGQTDQPKTYYDDISAFN